MNASLARFIDHAYGQVKADLPPDTSEALAKQAIHRVIQRKATEYADTLCELAETIETIKLVRQLVELQD